MRAPRQHRFRTIGAVALACLVGSVFVAADGAGESRDDVVRVSSATVTTAHVARATAPTEIRVIRNQRPVRRAVTLFGCLVSALAIAAIARRRRGEPTSTCLARLERTRSSRAPPHLRVS
jgi:hypothetical protein